MTMSATRLCIFFDKRFVLREHWMTRMRSQSLLWKHCETSCWKGVNTIQRWKKLLQSLQKVEPDSTLCNDWCNLSRNDFDHCTACYTVQWSVQLNLSRNDFDHCTACYTVQWSVQLNLSRNAVARQVARKIAPCNRALISGHVLVLVCNTMIDEEIWLALFRILLGIWCLLMHVNKGKIRNFSCLGEITD